MEAQPVNLKLCLYGGKETTVERMFDKRTTLDEIQKEMRKMFNINSDRETKLWINSSVYVFRPSIEAESKTDYSDASISDTKENDDSVTSATGENQNAFDSSTSTSSSPIKPPPTPPPMPANNSVSSATTTTVSTTISSTSSQNHNGATSKSTAIVSTTSTTPTVITRQAAHSMSVKPIALPDSTSSTTDDQIDRSNQTLIEAGISDSAVVTLEVINNDGTWPSSRPRYGAISTRSSKAQPGLCGLSNMGNTCFMNAALQCLSNTPLLTNYILTDKFLDDINTNNPLGMHGEIARTYAELIKIMWSGNHGSFLPREFKCAVSRFAPQFTGFAQQDCQELMAFLLDGLHEDLNRIRNKPYIEVKDNIDRRPDEEVAKESWDNYKKRNDSIVVDTFHAMLKSTLVCPECNLVSVTFDPFCYLSLPLPVKREKQINLTFLAAPAKLDQNKIKTALKTLDQEDIKLLLQFGGRISSFDGSVEERAGYLTQLTRPRNCKMQVPRSGPAKELCELVARIINEERGASSIDEQVKSENLVVAELANGKIQRVHESNEHYNQICDDIVVVEKASKYVVPVYVKERRENSTYDAPRLYFLHLPDLKYETLYKSIITSLSNLTTESEDEIRSWYKFSPPNELEEGEQSMECDDDENNEADIKPTNVTNGDDEPMDNEVSKQTNGKVDVISSSSSSPLYAPSSSSGGKTIQTLTISKNRPSFDISTVNSFGSHSFETLGPNRKECDYSSKLYLGVFFTSGATSTPQFDLESSNNIEIFIPKLSQKPTLQLKDCITQFTNAERLGADDPWYCPKCKKHQQAIKKFDIWSLPQVLIIHLKRFSFSRSWRDKIDTLVEFPVEKLDMSSFVHNPEQRKPGQPMIYNLIGVANHFGGLGGGHYTAYAKNAPLNAWYNFDDALVTQISANNVITRSAYVLFYQLQE